MQENLLNYLAGILDGEGSISLLKTIRKGRGNINPSYGIRITVEMCDKEIPELFFMLFGGSLQERAESGNHSTVYSWVIGNKSSLEFMNKIKNYIRLKRKKEVIKLAIELQNNISLNDKKFSKISKENLDIREDLYIKAKELNRRGP